MTPVPYLKLAAALIALCVAFAGGWTVEHWRGGVALAALQSKHSKALADESAKTLDAQKKLDVLADAQRARVAGIDDKQTQALKVAQDETQRLRSCIADGTCGLRIRAQCPKPAAIVPGATAGTSVDTATSAELDPTARQDYFALRSAIDLTQRQLSACQQILKR